MGSLSPGDRNMPHVDGSHRWLPPRPAKETEVAAWQAQIRAHLAEHLRQVR